MRELLAQMLNDASPPRTRPGASSRATIRARSSTCSRPTAASSATAPGFRRRTYRRRRAAAPARARRAGRTAARFLKAGAVAAALSVLVVPVFSAFRLELACVPMAAFGLALALERVVERVPRPAWGRAAVVLPENTRT